MPTTKTENLAGGAAYRESAKLELASVLLTSFMKDQFYSSADATALRVRELIAALPDKSFAAKAAVYARTVFGMRSITHVVAAEIAHQVKGAEWTKDFYNKVIYRPDDASEIFAYYSAAFGTPFPNSLKKGVALALARFSPYEMAKYRGEGKTFALVDLVNITHPKHTEAIAALVKGELKSADTWESKLSAAGQDAESDDEKAALKDRAWKDLILEGKLGYFALLRNLRNIVAQSPDVIDAACEQLVDEARIKKSLVLPFRFQKAIEATEGNDRRVTAALTRAMDISLSNVPKFPSKTLVALDTSGSMQGQPLNIGSLFAAAIFKANEGADLMTFSDNAQYIHPNDSDSLSTISKNIIGMSKSGGTNFHDIFNKASKRYDRIFILSDMQAWAGGYDTPKKEFEGYCERAGIRPAIYSFDLQGYGTLQFPEQNVYAFAGFSEKVFDVVRLFEEDRNALVNKIEAIELK